jgi:hypothetical protein
VSFCNVSFRLSISSNLRDMKMRVLPKVCSLLLIMMAVHAPAVVAQISNTDSTTIEFAGGRLPEGTRYSTAFETIDSGLVTKPTAPHTVWNVWFESPPLSAGMSWRPPTSTHVKLIVTGLKSEGGDLRAFFRYSCDRVHWSTWYNMTPESNTKAAASLYHGAVSLPRASREKYDSLMREWQKTDPDTWEDEHEFCVWLAKHHPDFFATAIPLIGYVQVRVEGQARRMQVGGMKIDQSWSVSGITGFSLVEPKRKPRATTGENWFFDLGKYTNQDNH